MIGKLFISVAYFHIYLMVSETFPTVLRLFALGICNSSGQVGAMVSAYVGDLVGNIYFTYSLCLLFRSEEFEDTKGVIGIRNSKKNRQNNGQ